MPTYVIGDIHGCHDTLQCLLDKIQFDRARDQLWLVGDLVNRGPHPLKVLRWAAGLGDKARMVLGNHDLHLLGVASGVLSAKKGEGWGDLSQTPDINDLMEWLRHLPLFHRSGPVAMVHAGLLPEWSLEDANALNQEVEYALRGPHYLQLLREISTQHHTRWYESLTGVARLVCILQVMTGLRTCTLDGRICTEFTGPITMTPPGCLPWFEIPGKRSPSVTVCFGHWAALGYYQGHGVVGLDGGCAWGGELLAMRVEDGTVFRQPNVDSFEV